MKRTLLLLLAAAMLVSLVCLASAEDKGGGIFEGFDVEVIQSTTSIAGEDAAPSAAEGLEISLGSWQIYEDPSVSEDPYSVWVALNVQIMNWDFTPVQLQDITAMLTFRGSYQIAGTPAFPVVQLGMLERVDGQLVFRLPLIVTQAQAGDLVLTVTAQGEEITQQADLSAIFSGISEEFPFNLDNAAAGGCDIALGAPAFSHSYNGIQDEVALWFIQPVRVVNWGSQAITLTGSEISASLVYLERYQFNAEIELSKTTLEPLGMADVQLAVRLPLVVTESGEGETRLSIEVGEQEFTQSMNMSAITARQGEYTVESVPGADYGFVLTGDGWYESTNAGNHNSYAICVVRFRSASGHIAITIDNQGESGYDYGMISPLDTMLELNNGASGAQETFRNGIQTIVFDVPDTEEHFICLKYRKDGSSHSGRDSLRFAVFGLNAGTGGSVTYTVEPVTGASYGFARNADGSWTSTNQGVNSSYSICVVRFRTNAGYIALDVSNSGESGYDYGMVSSLDTMLEPGNGSSDAQQTFSNGEHRIIIPVPDSGEHFICLKFRKDGSYSSGNDCLTFRVVDWE